MLYDHDKTIGMICHAGLVGISAGIVRGHDATGSEGIKDDLINAGATYVDQEVVRDGNLITSRIPDADTDLLRINLE
jgi:protease I